MELASLSLSLAAVGLSLLTAWLTLLRPGELKMTQPTVVFFGPDGPKDGVPSDLPKIFLRTLLFSTSKRGVMVESMYVRLTRNETVQNFNIWAYGENGLVRGSGLYVGETGIATNHHFLMPRDGSTFLFNEGDYSVQLFVKVLGTDQSRLVWSETLSISKHNAELMNNRQCGVYFDWGPDSKRYLPYIDESSEAEIRRKMPPSMRAMLGPQS